MENLTFPLYRPSFLFYLVCTPCTPMLDYANVQAIGAAIENMLLRATELGVGSLWIGDILTEDELLTQRYFSEGELIAGIVLGFSVKGNLHVQRHSLSELIVFDGGLK